NSSGLRWPSLASPDCARGSAGLASAFWAGAEPGARNNTAALRAPAMIRIRAKLMAAQVGWPIGRLVSHKCQPDSVSITAIVAASARPRWSDDGIDRKSVV